MSKKITLSLSDKNRPNLSALFSSYMKNRKKTGRLVRFGDMLIDVDDEDTAALLDYWDSVFPGWDEERPDDECEFIFPGKTLNPRGDKKGKRRNDPYKEYWSQEEREERWSRNLMGKSTGKKKHKRHGKSSRARYVDITEPMVGFIGDDDYEYDRLKDDDVVNPKVIFYPDYHNVDDKIAFRTVSEFNDFCEENDYFVPAYIANDLFYRNENHCCLNPVSEKRGILEIIGEGSYGELFYEVCEPDELQ